MIVVGYVGEESRLCLRNVPSKKNIEIREL